MIYCVEDEKNIRDLIVYTLGVSGFQTKGFATGEELDAALEEELPELILLDIMLPGEDGLSILQRLKENVLTNDIPVIMVTAKGAEYDKVVGLDSGADDYIAKPFGMMEFIARVKALLRRHKPKSLGKEIREGNIRVLLDQHKVFIGNTQIELTLKEYEMLRYFLENKGLVLSRDQLIKHIWKYDFEGETRTVDVHVRTLRQKLGADGDMIKTVRGVGYCVEDKG